MTLVESRIFRACHKSIEHSTYPSPSDVHSFIHSFMSCALCLTPFNLTDRCPRLLSCGHCYCTTCLSVILSQTNSVKCPSDSQVTQCQSTSHLPKNFALTALIETLARPQAPAAPLCDACENADGHNAANWCVECEKYLCVAHEGWESHHVVGVSHADAGLKAVVGTCGAHGNPLNLFDCKCQEMVCVGCVSVGGHKGHPTSAVSDAVAAKAETIGRLVEEAQAWVAELDNRANENEAKLQDSRAQFTAAEDDLKAAFAEVNPPLIPETKP